MLIIRRIARKYREIGFTGIVRRFLEKLRQDTIDNINNIYVWDFSATSPESTTSGNVSIIAIRKGNDLSACQLEKLDLFEDRGWLNSKLESRFSKGAILWLVSHDGELASYLWTIRGRHVDPYFFPFTNSDVLIFDVETFREFRGLGIVPRVINEIACILRGDGISRFLIDTGIWNTAMNRSLQRTPFKLIGTARKLTFFRKNITIWS